MQQSRRWFWLEASCVCLALCACSSDDDTPGKPKPHRDAGRSDSGKPTNPGFGDGGFNPGLIDASGINVPDEDAGDGTRLVLTPGTGMVTLDSADPKSVEFKAELSSGGPSEVPVRWSIDHRDVGTIDAGSGAFKPNGAAGVVTVTAKAGSLTTSVTITIVVKAKLEGDPDSGGTMPAGAGGLGGVGGEGGGTKITDKPLRDALDKPATADADLKWLYPYDGTVWPRGLPAPLLQWSHGAHAPAAVKLKIQVEPNYTAEIYLGPPTALGSGKPITRVPIPQAVWRNALQSGAKMKVSLTAAVSDGSGGYAAYSAASELSWTIAPTTLRGTVYYNSYGTKLAENYDGAKGGNNRFGGATLAIQRDAFDPTLIAGSTTTDSSGCRVCHVVASDGARMIAQHANNMVSSAYDLRDMNKETNYDAAQNGKFGWAALSPDGTIALGNSGPPGTNNPSSTASLNQSALYKVSDGTALTAQGFSEFVTQAATPAFSLDMKKVAFNFYSGPGNGSIMGNGRSLVVMDLAKVNDSTYGFTNPKAIYVADADKLAGWPFFLPDGSGVVFQLELKPGLGSEHFATRNDARGELWWADLEGRAHALERANGKGYLPVMAMGHADDATLQFEPTVAPLVAGGYAWVVFTSRRAYGNVATRNPAESDPRDYDLTPGNAGGPTTKKLWVTALDVPAKPDTDPSHPAFYLPAQEIYAGNSRGFWVLDACEENGKGCTGGDECCGGFCKLDPESGQGICGDIPDDACSNEYDKCNVDSDCCADTGKKLYCIGGRCGTTTLL